VHNVENSKMLTQENTTIELNPQLTNLATEIGLNVQRICENALKSAINRLQGVNMNKCLVDEAGFEPATSTMPTGTETSSYSEKKAEIIVKPETVETFGEFMTVNMRLEKRTVRETKSNIRRYLDCSNYVVNYETVSKFLKEYMTKSSRTYNAQLTSLRRFVRDFLHAPESILDFKMAPVDLLGKNITLPSKEQLKKGFEALTEDGEKALYLFTLSTGLRRSEIMGLTKDKIDFKLRSVVPLHFTRVKRSGITFYNAETEECLNRYLSSRPNDTKVFRLYPKKCKLMWHKVSESAGVKISPQILRVWFSNELGEQLVPDRFVDIFEGRAPRSVLAKNYTVKGIERLSLIYSKANLNILS
jgi:intergrase/recombinase